MRDPVPARVGEKIGFWQLEGRRLALWLPVAMGCGIWLYLTRDTEPAVWLCWLWLLPLTALVLIGAKRRGRVISALLWGGMTLGLGFALATWSAERAAAPMLQKRHASTVEGRIIGLSRAQSGAPRVLLDHVVIFGLAPERTPERLRLALIETARADVPAHGTRIRLHASVFPPGGPVEPGAFDFRQRAFFARIGGVGFSRTPVLIVPSVEIERPELRATGMWGQLWTRIGALRRAVADALIRALPGAEGAFAAAIITGDRSAVEEEHAEALRAANLAHLLAISGLHMGILTGLVFVAVRLLFALAPAIADRVPARKLAAVAALAAGCGYLLLSGATVATQRALIMVAVFYVAVLLDRPAISLRALAFAAMIVLAIRPISLLDVGFQMSFAATLALVAGYETLRRRAAERGEGARPARTLSGEIAGRFGVYLGALILTSALAGAATAPFAAYHFNRTAPWGIFANLAAVPAMGLWVAPMAIVSGLAAPFGLAQVPLEVMGQGIAWILRVAEQVASWPGAYRPIRAVPPGALALVVFGGLWLTLWRGTWRFAGLAALAAAMAIWWVAPLQRPDILISPGGRLIGVMGPEGRVLDRERGQGFAAEIWLRRDADAADQVTAATRPGLEQQGGWLKAVGRDGQQVLIGRGRKLDPLPEAFCRKGAVMILLHLVPPDGPCRAVGPVAASWNSSVAIHLSPDGVRLRYANKNKTRLWSPGRDPKN